MLKKILIGVGVLVVVAGGFMAYQSTRPRLSPAATAQTSADGLDVTVKYSSPQKRGRVVFGEKSENAVVPYGEYWRLGANEATEITFNKNVAFAGAPVKAGTYRMYAMPQKGTWKIILNSEIGKWGYFEPSHDKDILTIEVPSEATTAPQEGFIISFAKDPLKMELAWDTTAVHVPLAAN